MTKFEVKWYSGEEADNWEFDSDRQEKRQGVMLRLLRKQGFNQVGLDGEEREQWEAETTKQAPLPQWVGPTSCSTSHYGWTETKALWRKMANKKRKAA